jgi:Domain of unknown function (DUF1330)
VLLGEVAATVMGSPGTSPGMLLMLRPIAPSRSRRSARWSTTSRGEPAHTFEGGAPCRTTLIEFDTVEAAVAAYHSPGYQEALRVLGDAAQRDLRIVPAV